MRAVPWILVVLSGAIAFLLWLTRPICENEHRESARCPDTRAPARPAESTSSMSRQLELRPPQPPEDKSNRRAGQDSDPRCEDLPRLERCAEELRETQALVARCRKEAKAKRARVRPSVEQCLLLPAMRELAAPPQQSENGPAEDSRCLRNEQVRLERELSVRELLQEDLGLSAEETDWLSESACALKELRWMAVHGLQLDGGEASETWEMIRADRQEILRDLEEYLGPEQFARFRKIGGVGLLNDALDCHDDAVR